MSTIDDLSKFRAWFHDDELRRRLSFPTDDWFAYVTAGDAARSWAALYAGEIIAQVQVDRESPERGCLAFAMRPDRRGRGLGKRVLSAFLSGPGLAYPVLEGQIEFDNVASLACCRRCGFTIAHEPDADGFIRASYRSKQ
ncbi:GNAT family N-acetyltransferase [Methylosinus sporium]